jgi:GMP synthase-like glutamine amidotransferase
MRIHCIRHEPFEGLAAIKSWIQLKNHQLSYTHIYLNENFPPVDDFDLLIIMGGSASVYEKNLFPWLKEEKKFIQNAIKKDKKILGICLGAQLLADALGGKVFKSACKEIGWFPVKFNISGLPGLNFLPETLEVFHWHGDTFDIPQGGVCIGSSQMVQNQGVVYGKNIIALQFHCEMDDEQIEMIINGAGKELLEEGKFIQSKKQIMDKLGQIPSNNKLMFDILEYLSGN